MITFYGYIRKDGGSYVITIPIQEIRKHKIKTYTQQHKITIEPTK